jgi:hypothetical protein
MILLVYTKKNRELENKLLILKAIWQDKDKNITSWKDMGRVSCMHYAYGR